MRDATLSPEEAASTYATSEAARVLGVSSRRVRKMIASGELTARRDKQGHHRIPRDAVRAKLKERGATPPTAAASEGRGGTGGPDEPRGDLLREELESVRQELGSFAREVRALRSELVPLARLARSAQEGKERSLREQGTLREERARLLEELEEERRRASELEKEHEAFLLKWWSRQMRHAEDRGS
jgi:excisionase family DNA binding protein